MRPVKPTALAVSCWAAPEDWEAAPPVVAEPPLLLEAGLDEEAGAPLEAGADEAMEVAPGAEVAGEVTGEVALEEEPPALLAPVLLGAELG
jgi:hypothetical protein